MLSIWLHYTQVIFSARNLPYPEAWENTEVGEGRTESQILWVTSNKSYPLPDIRQWKARKELEASPLRTESGIAQLHASLCPHHPPFPNRNGSFHPLSHTFPPPSTPPFPNKTPDPFSCHTFTHTNNSLIHFPTYSQIKPQGPHWNLLNLTCLSLLQFYFTSPNSRKTRQQTPQGNQTNSVCIKFIHANHTVPSVKEQGTMAQIYSAKNRSIQCQSASRFRLTYLQWHDLSQFVYKCYYQLSAIYSQPLIPCLNIKSFCLILSLATLGFWLSYEQSCFPYNSLMICQKLVNYLLVQLFNFGKAF